MCVCAAVRVVVAVGGWVLLVWFADECFCVGASGVVAYTPRTRAISG